MYSIYRITNNVNNKSYIGITHKPERRWQQHKTSSRSGSKQHIHAAMRKYGIESFSFEVIATCDDFEVAMTQEEPRYIEMYEAYTKGYNMVPGGQLINTAHRRAVSSDRMKRSNPMKVLRTNAGSFTPGHKPKFGPNHSQKIREAKLGSNNPNYGKPETSKRLTTKVACPKCGFETTPGNMSRWHVPKCY